jgi:hypothetical protein
MLETFEMLLSQEKLDLKESIRNRESEFKKRYDIDFRESRIDLVATRMIEKGYDVNTVIEEVVEIQRQINRFVKDFDRRLGISIRFKDEAIDRITEIILNEEGKGAALLSRLSKDYEYGLELIRDKTGQKEFVMPEEAIHDSEGYLNRMIREIYSRQADQRFEGKE